MTNKHLDLIQNLNQFKLPPNFRGRSALFVQLWWLIQGTFFRWSPQGFYGFRRWLLRVFGADIGVGVLVRPSVKVVYPWKVVIKDHAWIGDDVVIYSFAKITIGENAVVSQKSYLCAGTHDYSKPHFDIDAKPIIIGKQAWLATDVFVAPGISIGDGAVIGARSSVFSDMPPMMVCVGSPARPIKLRFAIAEADTGAERLG
jgi:putative colanic acid biosynthesis acetyltransferase WcaF